MKPKLTLALVALITGSAFAAIPKVLPEFKNEKQLAEWREEMAAKHAATTNASDDHAFYTGKPYIESTGSYAFKYRSYNPELARWTSEDPSGFPDGANGNVYAPSPTRDFDFQGLLAWSTLTNTNATFNWSHGGNNLQSEVWTVKTDDGSATINLWKNTTAREGSDIGGYNYIFNCHGYTFGNSGYWINGQIDEILKGDGYKLITGSNKTGARVAYWGSNVHSAVVNNVSSSGTVTSVTGKLGAELTLTSTPAGQGYGTNISYYE